jgi:hypothetical protein
MVKANPQAIKSRQAEANLKPSASSDIGAHSSNSAATTMLKLCAATDIFNAAQVLYRHGLISELPHTFVKRYVEANPDINESIARLG